MAVLGVGGKLYLKRQAPDAVLVDGSTVDGNLNALSSIGAGYWSGDRVITSCLPSGVGTFPPNPEGYAMYYGGQYFLGPNRSHITADNDTFYKGASETYPDNSAGGSAQFYARVGDTVGSNTITDCQEEEWYVHIDELGYASFYTTRCLALRGRRQDRVNLLGTIYGAIGIAPYGSTSYNNSAWRCFQGFNEYNFSDVQDTVSIASLCDDAPDYETPEAGTGEYANANVTPRDATAFGPMPYWQLIADMAEWSLELSAPSVDTTSISEKFGEAVKSLVTGGGSTEFLIDRKCYGNLEDNGLTLMKLLLMTEKGCNAEAKFYVINRTLPDQTCGNLISGDLYYETELLVTASAVNVRPTEFIAGTANFVTTGPIKLKEAE